MRSTWNLSNPSSPTGSWTEREVLLAFNGPQLVVLESDGKLYLSVASDADETATRWLRSPITPAEFNALVSGTTTVRDCILKPEILVVDTDADGHSLKEFRVAPGDLSEDDLPASDSVLPDDVVAMHEAPAR